MNSKRIDSQLNEEESTIEGDDLLNMGFIASESHISFGQEFLDISSISMQNPESHCFLDSHSYSMSNLEKYDDNYSCSHDYDNYSQQSYKSINFKNVKIPSLPKKEGKNK